MSSNFGDYRPECNRKAEPTRHRWDWPVAVGLGNAALNLHCRLISGLTNVQAT
jgi:hypothetical protein